MSKQLKKPTSSAFKLQEKTRETQSFLKRSCNKTPVNGSNLLFDLPDELIDLIYYFKHRDLTMNLFVGKAYNFAFEFACAKMSYTIQIERSLQYFGLKIERGGYDSPRKNIKPFDLNYMGASCRCKGKTLKNKPCGSKVKHGLFCRFHKNKKTIFDF